MKEVEQEFGEVSPLVLRAFFSHSLLRGRKTAWTRVGFLCPLLVRVSWWTALGADPGTCGVISPLLPPSLIVPP